MNNIDLENIVLKPFLTKKELRIMFSHNQLVQFNKDEFILKQGKKIDGVYLILEGNVRITTKLLGQGVNEIETLGPGNFIGEISFIEHVPCATSVIANRKVICLFLNTYYFALMGHFFPDTKYKLYQAIAKQVCDRLKKMHDKVIHLITAAEMMTCSLFQDVIQSFTTPENISLKDANIMKDQLSRLLFQMSKEEVDILLHHSSLLRVPKNCTLIQAHKKNPACYIVIQGAVQSSIRETNKIAKLSVIGPNTLFADVGFVSHADFTITFSTCEHSILLKLTKADLIAIKQEKKHLWYQIFYLISRSLVALEKSIDKLDIRLKIEEYNR